MKNDEIIEIAERVRRTSLGVKNAGRISLYRRGLRIAMQIKGLMDIMEALKLENQYHTTLKTVFLAAGGAGDGAYEPEIQPVPVTEPPQSGFEGPDTGGNDTANVPYTPPPPEPKPPDLIITTPPGPYEPEIQPVPVTEPPQSGFEGPDTGGNDTANVPYTPPPPEPKPPDPIITTPPDRPLRAPTDQGGPEDDIPEESPEERADRIGREIQEQSERETNEL